MRATQSAASGSGIVNAIADCMTPEAARRILALKQTPAEQRRTRDLAERHNLGLLNDAEREEYLRFARQNTFIMTMKARARLLLKQAAE